LNTTSTNGSVWLKDENRDVRPLDTLGVKNEFPGTKAEFEQGSREYKKLMEHVLGHG